MRKRGNKKSQITVFIIVAIVIVIVALLILYFSAKSGLIFETGIDSEIEPVYSFVQNCVDKTSEDAIYYIGQTGGYFLVPEKSTEGNIPYYFNKGENLLPTKERIEEELSLYLNQGLFFCTKNFIDFPELEVKQQEIISEVEIVEDKVIFKIKYPLSIKKAEKTYTFEKFNSEIPSRLNTIYDTVENIIGEQMLYHGGVCVNCISDIAYENKVYVSMNDDPFNPEVIIFSIIDDQDKINNEEYVFYFANRYEVENELLEE
ncbi:MAG: hypothetical protein ABIH37_03685 [archaeon]